jgi:peptidoglycan hydrolase CwlO-like protein
MNTVKDKDVLMEHVESLRTNLDNTNRTIVELTDQKMNLQAEVSQLRNNLEHTSSSKDKIILKLRQEI